MTSEEFAYLWLLALAGLAVLFVVPTIIAFRRGHPNRWPILIVNVCLGGTGLGWAAALIWALHAVHRTGEEVGSHGGVSGLNLFADDVRRVAPASGRSEAAYVPLTTAAAVADIERLSRLRERGTLNAQEFETAKSDVLRRLP